ncbi:MAG: transglycosylase SLT domain-containing protein [Deltaproteobacteria bacterium]|nr:transglycosylase SLT domain-containing protein [Deltaproteobacteria bacterium]
MTIGIYEKPSLLASLLAKESAERTEARGGAEPDGLFAGKLDSLLSGNGQEARSEQTKAQAVAEALNLQMLHTTMTLAGDAPSEAATSPLLGRQSSAIQALLQAYNANQQESDGVPAQPPEAPSQLQELTETPSITPPQSVPSAQGSQWLDPIIAKASRRYGVDMGLIKAVIKAESNFNPNAVSHAGARGLMQLMPGTARSLGVSDSFDAEQNVMGGTRFLRDLLDRYNGDLDSALAAYNWGPGNVDKRPGRLPAETREYLVRVKQLYSSYTG